MPPLSDFELQELIELADECAFSCLQSNGTQVTFLFRISGDPPMRFAANCVECASPFPTVERLGGFAAYAVRWYHV